MRAVQLKEEMIRSHSHGVHLNVFTPRLWARSRTRYSRRQQCNSKQFPTVACSATLLRMIVGKPCFLMNVDGIILVPHLFTSCPGF